MRDDSTTFDEIAHLTAGYSYWTTGDFRLQPENVMLPRWAALPLLAGGWRFPSLDQPAWRDADAYALGYHFFYDEGNDVGALLWRARAAMALTGLPLGLLVWTWSRRLWGTAGAVIALVLFTFCPTMLANGALVTADLTAALFFNLALFALWRLLHRVSAGTLVASLLAVAGLFLTIKTAPLLGVITILLVGVRLVVGPPLVVALGRARVVTSRGAQLVLVTGLAIVHGVVVVVVLWAGYGFRWEATRDAGPGREGLAWEDVTPVPAPLEVARTHRLLPEAYLYGLAYTLRHAQARRAFLDGRWSEHGWWWFFPYCLAVKTPLPLFGLLALAAAGVWRRRAGPAPPLYETVPLWVLLAVYWAMALASHLNVGHRHLAPTYPAMFILAGGAALWLVRRGVMARLVGALLALFVGESLLRYPHYLAYFNALAGGPAQGYRRLVDSSLDWGQDLPGLARWLDRQGLAAKDATPVYLSYFGTGLPEYYGIRATRLPSFYDHWRRREWYILGGGTYCVSATMLQQVYSQTPGPWTVPYERLYQPLLAELRDLGGEPDPARREVAWRAFAAERLALYEQLRFARLCAYLRGREPDAQIGYSINCYRLSDNDVVAATEGPPVELRPEIAVEGLALPGTS